MVSSGACIRVSAGHPYCSTETTCVHPEAYRIPVLDRATAIYRLSFARSGRERKLRDLLSEA
jgi:hypothetical protein